MADAIKNRNHLANLIALASDDAKSAPLRHQLRSLEKEIMKERSAVSDPARDAQLAQLATELRDYVRQGQESVAVKYIERIQTLMLSRSEPAQGGQKKMGLFDKLKDKLGGKPKVAAEDAARSNVDNQLFELEKNVALLAEKRAAQVEQLRGMVQQAAGMDPNSYEYKQIRARASLVKNQIKLYEGQIDAQFRALMDNQRYLQLIDNGMTMKNLSALLPNPAEADAILDDLTRAVQKVQDQQEAFSDVIGAYGNKMDAGMAPVLDAADDDFDSAVAAARGDVKEAPAPAAPVQETPVTETPVQAEKPEAPAALTWEEPQLPAE